MTVYEEFVVHELRRIANALEGINKKMESQGAVCGPLWASCNGASDEELRKLGESITNTGFGSVGFYDCSDIKDGSTIKEGK